MNGNSTVRDRLSLRGWARHAGVAPSYAFRLVTNGVIARGSDRRISVAEADAALAALRSVASPGRLLANAAKRAERQRLEEAAATVAPETPLQRAESQGVCRVMAAFDTNRIPLQPAALGEEALVDAVEADAALNVQVAAMSSPEFVPTDAIEALAQRMELRLAAMQSQIYSSSLPRVVAAAGGRHDRLSKALGAMFGRLRHALDQERALMIEELRVHIQNER